jgi:hypothetical protein
MQKLALINANSGDNLPPAQREEFLLSKKDPQLDQLRALLTQK